MQSAHIFNGAHCGSYCWTQSYSELEIRIFIERSVDWRRLKATLDGQTLQLWLRAARDELLFEARLLHATDAHSLFWQHSASDSAIVVFLDKKLGGWWSAAVAGETQVALGAEERRIAAHQVPPDAQMAIERLLHQQVARQLQSCAKLVQNRLNK